MSGDAGACGKPAGCDCARCLATGPVVEQLLLDMQEHVRLALLMAARRDFEGVDASLDSVERIAGRVQNMVRQ